MMRPKDTRMKPLALLAILTTLALPAAAQDMRSFTDDGGRAIEVPADPQRIVVIDNQIITAPLYELGRSVIGTVGRIDEGVNGGAPYMRSVSDLLGLQFGDESGITYIGGWRSPDLEVIAALEPDLIITVTYAAEIYDQLAIIAPTAAVEFEQPMLDIYRKVAEIVGETAQFEDRLRLYEAKITAATALLEDEVGDLAEITIAVAEPTFDEGLWITRDLSSVSQVAADLGLGMPELYTEMEDSWVQLSPERVAEINADFLIGSYSTIFDGDRPSDKRAAFEALLPGYETFLHAPRHGQHILFDREQIRPVRFDVLETTLAILVSHIGTRRFVPIDEGG